LATAGPFIYLYFQKKAEDRLLQEQRQYQATLRQASMGMGQIKDLKRLLNFVVHIITRTVWIEHCEIYLLHEDSKQFILKASRGWRLESDQQVSALPPDSPLVSYLRDLRESIVYEEISQYAQDYQNALLNKIKEVIRRLDGALVIPSFIDQKLIAVLVLGEKRSGKMYSRDDLAVFTILASQAAMAIENAEFYEKIKETHHQLIRAEKMATVGTMADGLSHQINNRLHAMGFIAGDALDTINLKKKEDLSPDFRSFLDEISRPFHRIEENVRRGGEIVQGLLKYTRKGSELFEAVDLNALIDAAIEMARFKIKLDEVHFSRSIAEDIPKIKGNFTQLQEVLFNIIDNSYEAMTQRKTEMKEEGFKLVLQISAQVKEQKVEVVIRDNGIGVRPEDAGKLFTPFFTTKLSSRKGTGLGLYVMRQIIEENHGGKVEFTSEYREWSQVSMVLSAADGGEEVG
jgi:signal transduction histidine kinase